MPSPEHAIPEHATPRTCHSPNLPPSDMPPPNMPSFREALLAQSPSPVITATLGASPWWLLWPSPLHTPAHVTTRHGRPCSRITVLHVATARSDTRSCPQCKPNLAHRPRPGPATARAVTWSARVRRPGALSAGREGRHTSCPRGAGHGRTPAPALSSGTCCHNCCVKASDWLVFFNDRWNGNEEPGLCVFLYVVPAAVVTTDDCSSRRVRRAVTRSVQARHAPRGRATGPSGDRGAACAGDSPCRPRQRFLTDTPPPAAPDGKCRSAHASRSPQCTGVTGRQEPTL